MYRQLHHIKMGERTALSKVLGERTALCNWDCAVKMGERTALWEFGRENYTV